VSSGDRDHCLLKVRPAAPPYQIPFFESDSACLTQGFTDLLRGLDTGAYCAIDVAARTFAIIRAGEVDAPLRPIPQALATLPVPVRAPGTPGAFGEWIVNPAIPHRTGNFDIGQVLSEGGLQVFFVLDILAASLSG
jgi:hypothetical protein